MANPSVTNVTGSNPGPNADFLPDTIQLPTGNLWKSGLFQISITPTIVATITTVEEAFAATGIGLLTTDVVVVTGTQAQTVGVGIVGARVSAADTLSIQFVNPTAAGVTPYSGLYNVAVFRIQPNWMKPATGIQMDW